MKNLRNLHPALGRIWKLRCQLHLFLPSVIQQVLFLMRNTKNGNSHMLKSLAQGVQRLLLEIDILLSETRVMEGLKVHHASNRVEAEDAFAKVAAALKCLEEHDVRRMRRVRRYVRRVLIAQQSHDAYLRYACVCALSDKNLMEQPAAWTASVLVHEAVHARVHARGLPGDALEARRRIERLCVSEQRRFLARVPGTDGLRRHLDSEVTTEWFSEKARYDAQVARLEALDAPRWLVRWMKRRGSG